MTAQHTTASERAAEALDNARNGQSLANYPAIFEGFMEKGIPEADIQPRENVFTFNAWKALGRTVKRGEHGVRVNTWVPIPEKRDDDDTVVRPAGKRPKVTTVFHVSQTKPLNGGADQ